MSEKGLARRTIRSRLIERYSWNVQSRTSGVIDIEVPHGTQEAAFAEEVRAAFLAMDLEPTLFVSPYSGSRWVRVSTSETIAEKGKGEHQRKRS